MMIGADQRCFRVCRSCLRCEDKGRYAKCASCNGRVSSDRPAHPDDYCRCSEGVLQVRTKDGRIIQRKFMSSPYGGEVKTDAESQDEREWNSYIEEKREELFDPNWDPVRFSGGQSTFNWIKKAREMGL